MPKKIRAEVVSSPEFVIVIDGVIVYSSQDLLQAKAFRDGRCAGSLYARFMEDYRNSVAPVLPNAK